MQVYLHCVNNVSSVNRINNVWRKIEFIARYYLHLWSHMVFFLQEPDSRDAVEQNCNRLTIFLHHNNSKSSGTQSSKVTCVDYLLFICLLSKKIIIDCFSFSETFSSLSFQKDRSVFPQQANLVPVNLGTPSSWSRHFLRCACFSWIHIGRSFIFLRFDKELNHCQYW